MRKLSEIGGKRLPFLRWSVLRMALGARHLSTHWQVGDGREEALAAHVTEHARKGDVDDVIRVIDEFCYQRSAMMNVGDEKGEILDRAVRRVQPRRLLELGTYCGYSALRMARVMPPDAQLYSIEFSPANSEIARRIWEQAGIADRVTVVVGSLGDGGQTMDRLESEHGFTRGARLRLRRPRQGRVPPRPPADPHPPVAAFRFGRGRRQRQGAGGAEVPRLSQDTRGRDLAHRRVRHPVGCQNSITLLTLDCAGACRSSRREF